MSQYPAQPYSEILDEVIENGGATTDASLLVSGTLDDARLSSNVPLFDESIDDPTYDFYVSLAGLDTNAGTFAQPFRTLAKLASVIANNQSAGLRRGDIWFEDLDLSGKIGVTIAAYGDTRKRRPIIDGTSPVVTPFTKTGGLTNVYQFAVSQTVGEAYLQIWENNINLKWVANTTLCDSTPGSFTITGATAGSNKSAAGTQTFYIHAFGSTNPQVNNATYRITDPTRLGRLKFSGTARSIHTRRNSHADGSLVGDGLAEDCLMTEGVKHESLLGAGEYRNCQAWHPADDARTNAIIMEFYAPNGVGYSCVYTNCSVRGPGPAAVQAVEAYGGHNSGPGTLYDSVTISDSYVWGCSTGFSFEAATVSATRFRADECDIAMWPQGSNGSLLDCAFSNVASPMYRPVVCGTTVSKTVVTGLRGYVRDILANSSVFFNGNADIRRSALYVAETGSLYCSIVGSSFLTNFDIQGLALFTNTPDRVSIVELYNASSTFSANNNCYWPEHLNAFQAGGVNASNMTAYLAAVRPGKEAATVVANPGFFDPENLDFTITNSAVNTSLVGCERPCIKYRSPVSLEEMQLLAQTASGDLLDIDGRRLVANAQLAVLAQTSGVNTGDQDLSGKQDVLTLTTTGSSGAATLIGSTLNIPQYSGGGGGGVAISGTPTTGQAAEFTNATTVQGVATTGSGNYVKATSPTLTTPNIGVASGTSVSLSGTATATGVIQSVAGVICGDPTSLDSGKGLQVEKNFGTGGGSGIKIRNTNASGYTEVVLNSDNNRADGCVVFGLGGSTAGGVPNEVYLSNRIGGIQFYTQDAYRARILANGRMLLNTNTDDGGSRLQVVGNIATTTLTVGGGTGPLLRNNGLLVEVRNNANNANGPFGCGTIQVGGGTTATSILSATATLDFGSIAAGASADLTITVTGAVAGDASFLGIPSAAFVAGITYSWSVLSANTVTVRATNTTASAIDPPSGVFRSTVIRH